MLMIEKCLKCLIVYGRDVANRPLDRIPLRNQNLVILFIMGMLQRMGADQPRLFVQYVYWLDWQVGWYSCCGPMRRFISVDTFPISHQEHDAREDWLVWTGEKREPNYKIVALDGCSPRLRVHDPRELYFLDEPLNAAGNSSASGPTAQVEKPELFEC
jgi:hypothetical protein